MGDRCPQCGNEPACDWYDDDQVRECLDRQIASGLDLTWALYQECLDTAASLRADVVRLREALKPFAEHMDFIGELDDPPADPCPMHTFYGFGASVHYLTWGDFRAVKAAMKEN